MLPVLFTIGPFNVYAFGFFLTLAFIFSTFIVWKYGREELKEEEYLDAYLYTSFFSLIAARAVYIFLHFDEFKFNLLRYIVVRETPGLSLLGGMLAGFFFLWWYCRKKNYDFSHLLDLLSISTSFFLVFAKIGEQLGGAGFGRETNSFFGVKIIGLTNRRHPAEIYEACAFLLLSIILLVLYNKTQRTQIQKAKFPSGIIFLIFSLCFSLIVFLLEFFKNYPVYLYGLSFRQIIALSIFLICVYPLFKKVKSANIKEAKKI